MQIHIKKGMVRNGTVHIYYEVTTPENYQNTLFFIHGLGGDSAAWKKQINFFSSKGYQCIAIDLRGHGFSDHPEAAEEYSLHKFAEDIALIAEKEDIEKIIPVGHCLGGMVSLMYALQYPQYLDGLILIDTSYKQPDYLDIVTTKPYLYSILLSMIRYSPRFYSREHMDIDLCKGSGNMNIKRILDDLRRISLKTYLSICENLTRYSVADALNSIAVPTLIVHGLKDTIIPLIRADILHKKIHRSILTYIPQANHILLTNNPDEVSIALNDFLTKAFRQTRL